MFKNIIIALSLVFAVACGPEEVEYSGISVKTGTCNEEWTIEISEEWEILSIVISDEEGFSTQTSWLREGTTVLLDDCPTSYKLVYVK